MGIFHIKAGLKILPWAHGAMGLFVDVWTRAFHGEGPAMIILEFQCQDFFKNASRLLEACNLPFLSQVSLQEWRPSLIYFFEDEIRTGRQREALKRARDFEREDRRQQNRQELPNLADPI